MTDEEFYRLIEPGEAFRQQLDSDALYLFFCWKTRYTAGSLSYADLERQLFEYCDKNGIPRESDRFLEAEIYFFGYETVFPSEYYTESGKPIWPANDGFLDTPKNVTLEVGTRVDRYGHDAGNFVSPEGTPYEQRSLPRGYSSSQPYVVYEVIKPIVAKAGTVAPWFGEPGGGIQYKFYKAIKDLLVDENGNGYLKIVN